MGSSRDGGLYDSEGDGNKGKVFLKTYNVHRKTGPGCSGRFGCWDSVQLLVHPFLDMASRHQHTMIAPYKRGGQAGREGRGGEVCGIPQVSHVLA